MIGGLRGTLASVDVNGDGAAEVMIDVNGVSYDVVVGARCAAGMPAIGEPIELSIYTHVREGVFALFGFPDREERKIFSLIITAHGVGPTLGLAILGGLSPSALVRAVTTGDVDALTVIPGVGKKTAQRLVIDLAERLGSVTSPSIPGVDASSEDGDLRDALSSLGYDPEDIRAVLDSIPEEGTVEQRLRNALRELAPTAVAR